MLEFVTVMLAPAGAVLAVFSAYELFFLVVSVVARFGATPRVQPEGQPGTRFCILIPAHNEELLIGDLVDSVRRSDYPTGLYDIVVIADNCEDRTAQIAREHGAQVLERFDVIKRGKPYALHWVLQRLDLARYDAFVILDADTVIAPTFLATMARELRNGSMAIQGYFGVMNPNETWLTRLSILLGVLKFRLHNPGKMFFGLSCTLAGNGMCFDAEIFRRFGWNAFSIAENWEYYAILTLNGYVVSSSVDAVIYSQVARSLKSGKSQRMRWMKGRIGTLRQYWKPLLFGSSPVARRVRWDALLELARPSHALLMFWSLLFLGVTTLLWHTGASGPALPVIAAVIILAQAVNMFAGLIVQRAPLRTWLSLCMVPLYLVWKVSVSVLALAGLRDRRWIKTERHRST
jgi:cellulose synthase/poly-beta-1,6-N-acetylglucosamine synthase-like glycosyltransferase